MKSRSHQFLASLLALAGALSTIVQAQEPPRRPGNLPGESERGPREFRGRQDGPGPRGMFDPLNLTEEQRNLFREAAEANRDEMDTLMQRMNDARRALQDAIFADKPDENIVKARAREAAEVQAETTVFQARIIAKLVPKLSAEQRERARNMPTEFIFRAAMGGGPGGGPYGGPGGFRPGGPDSNPRPDGQRLDPDNPPRRPRGEAPAEGNGNNQRRRPEADPSPK